MKTNSSSALRVSSIEPLESRIAPAGIVNVTLVGGNLAIMGDASDNTIEVQQLGPNAIVITPDATTAINLAPPGTRVVVLGELTGNLTSRLGDGSDVLKLSLIDIPGNLAVTDTGATALEENLITLGGAVSIGGKASITTGPGVDTVEFLQSFYTVGRDFIFDLGDGRNSVVSGLGGTLTVGGTIKYVGGSGDDSFVLQNIPLNAAGIVIATGAGTNAVLLDPRHMQVGGAVSITHASPVGEVSGTTIVGSGEIAGAVTIMNGDGVNSTTVESTGSLRIAGGIRVAGGAGNDSVTLTGSDLKVGGMVSVLQGEGTNRFENFASGRLRGLTVSSGAGADSFILNAPAFRVGTVMLNAGAGANTAVFGGADLVVQGNVTVLNANTAGQTVSTTFNADSLTVTGNLKITNAEGNSSAIFNQPSTVISGSIAFRSVGQANFELAGGNVDITGGLTVGTGVAADSVIIAPASIEIRRGLTANLGAGGDSFTYFSSGAVGPVLIEAGAGANTAEFGDLSVRGGVTIRNANTAGQSVNTTFNGSLTVTGNLAITNGDGDSSALIEGAFADIGGNIKFTSNAGNDSFQLRSESARMGGSIIAQTGSGDDSVRVTSQGIDILGITAALGDGNDTFAVTSWGKIRGSVALDKTGFEGSNTVNIGFPTGAPSDPGLPLAIAGSLKLVAQSVVGDSNQVEINDVSVGGATTVKLGDGPTTIDVMDILARGAFTLTTGLGSDVINIERENFLAESVFAGAARITMGAGAIDLLRIGNNTLAGKAVFLSTALFDGGDGVFDIANVSALAFGNGYLPGQPVIVNFETTG